MILFFSVKLMHVFSCSMVPEVCIALWIMMYLWRSMQAEWLVGFFLLTGSLNSELLIDMHLLYLTLVLVYRLAVPKCTVFFCMLLSICLFFLRGSGKYVITDVKLKESFLTFSSLIGHRCDNWHHWAFHFGNKNVNCCWVRLCGIHYQALPNTWLKYI